VDLRIAFSYPFSEAISRSYSDLYQINGHIAVMRHKLFVIYTRSLFSSQIYHIRPNYIQAQLYSGPIIFRPNYIQAQLYSGSIIFRLNYIQAQLYSGPIIFRPNYIQAQLYSDQIIFRPNYIQAQLYSGPIIFRLNYIQAQFRFSHQSIQMGLIYFFVNFWLFSIKGNEFAKWEEQRRKIKEKESMKK
jgi:hypothetical protein